MTAAEFVESLRAFFPNRANKQDEAREGSEGLWTLDGAGDEWAVYLKSDLDLELKS
jgi:hypothetical protein